MLWGLPAAGAWPSPRTDPHDQRLTWLGPHMPTGHPWCHRHWSTALLPHNPHLGHFIINITAMAPPPAFMISLSTLTLILHPLSLPPRCLTFIVPGSGWHHSGQDESRVSAHSGRHGQKALLSTPTSFPLPPTCPSQAGWEGAQSLRPNHTSPQGPSGSLAPTPALSCLNNAGSQAFQPSRPISKKGKTVVSLSSPPSPLWNLEHTDTSLFPVKPCFFCQNVSKYGHR